MSGNRKELLNARRAAREAAAILEAIEALPRRKGSRVRWRNGVIWERRGDDDWRPVAHIIGTDNEVVDVPEEQQHRYSSAHVASFGFWVVSGR